MNAHCVPRFQHWNEPGGAGIDGHEFTQRVNEGLAADAQLREGYAPFCKHVILPNFTQLPPFCMAITPHNETDLCTDYAARNNLELPVLRRFFPRATYPNRPPARFLDIILYSREQIEREGRAVGRPPGLDKDYDWAIVSFKAQDEDAELPMTPITMMRNAVGPEQGGSGEPLDREKYLTAVGFWSEHAEVV